jgi:hypothetical protein
MKPTVGRIVKYNGPPTNGTEYAALITATHDDPVGYQRVTGELHIHATVFTPNGSYEVYDVPFEGSGMSSWRWPERV